MSVTWSGPGKALQAHLDLFKLVTRAHDWVIAHQGKGVTPAMIDAAPITMLQRLRLMTSMGDAETIDGLTVATQRDNVDQMHSQHTVSRGTGLVNTEWDILNRGETHYISHHIAATIAAAAEQTGDEPLFPTDLPAPRGLMVFEYPLIVPDLHPETGEIVPELEMPIRAIAWGPSDNVHARNEAGELVSGHPGIFYAIYTDNEAWTTLFAASVQRHLPDEYAENIAAYENWDRLRDPIWCIDTSAWTFGKSWKRSESLNPVGAAESREIHQTVAYVRRFLLALWRFEWQRILVPEVHKPSRAEHRQALRAGMKLEDGYIKVLRLRRHVEMEARGERPESDPFAYDHQWIVRGHPRRQWFPSLGPARNPDGSFNHDSHRQIWIEPHAKGNPYAPLIVGHNVTAVVR